MLTLPHFEGLPQPPQIVRLHWDPDVAQVHIIETAPTRSGPMVAAVVNEKDDCRKQSPLPGLGQHVLAFTYETKVRLLRSQL